MRNDQLFIPINYGTVRHKRKRGMPVEKRGGLSTADLTRAIIKHIRFRGGYAVRINVQGRWDEKKQQWRKSATERGTADIHACIDGAHVSIEIKTGADRVSVHQKKIQEEVEAAGGFYLIINEYIDFYNWYKNR